MYSAFEISNKQTKQNKNNKQQTKTIVNRKAIQTKPIVKNNVNVQTMQYNMYHNQN